MYLGIKQYACCDVLNFLGGLWLALLVVGACGAPLTLATFWWLGRMDKLEPKGCVGRRGVVSESGRGGEVGLALRGGGGGVDAGHRETLGRGRACWWLGRMGDSRAGGACWRGRQ